MKINRKGMVFGFATLGIAAALATGVGVAQAGTGPTPAASTSPTAPFGHGGGMGAMMVGQRSCLTAAASYLGLSETDLQTQLQAGKSLADVAKDKGKSVSGLQEAMTAAMKSAVNANTTLTAEQKATCLAQLESRIATMINQTHTPGAGRGHRGGWMHGTTP